MKPSDIADIDPMGSVLQKSEYETIAQNIALILSKNGNTFRRLFFSDYTRARLDDGAPEWAVENEEMYFDKVVGYLETEHSARLFSRCWNLPLASEPAPSIERFARLFDLPLGQLLYWIDYDSDDDQYVVNLQTYKNGVQMNIKGYVADRELAIKKMEAVTEEGAIVALDSLLGLIENPMLTTSKSIFQNL